MLPDEKTKRSLAVEVSVIIKLSEMPSRLSTVTCLSVPGRNARTERGMCRNSSNLLTFRFSVQGERDTPLHAMSRLSLPSRTREFLSKTT